VQRVQILGSAVGDFVATQSAHCNQRMGAEPTALSAWACRQPEVHCALKSAIACPRVAEKPRLWVVGGYFASTECPKPRTPLRRHENASDASVSAQYIVVIGDQPVGVRAEGRSSMLMLFKIVMTSSVVWFMIGLVGLIFKSNGMRPNFLMGLAVFLTATLVGYMWDLGQLVR